MIIACPRCEASYAVDDAEFGPRNGVVRCSACDFRWSQRPHEAGEGNAGEGSSPASPNADVADAPDRLEPIREAEPVGPEAPVSESALPIAAEEAPSAPAPAADAATAAGLLLDGQVRYSLQEHQVHPLRKARTTPK